MQNLSNKWREQDFCTVDQGMDYIFGKMGAIYGAMFTRNWAGVDPTLIRQVWADECGRMLTYRVKLDYALKHMNPDRPPTALQFKALLNAGPLIPDKPDFHLEVKKTPEQVAADAKRADEARAMIRQLVAKMKKGGND